MAEYVVVGADVVGGMACHVSIYCRRTGTVLRKGKCRKVPKMSTKTQKMSENPCRNYLSTRKVFGEFRVF